MNMKKKIISIVAALLAISSVSVSAGVNIPQPKDNAEAYKYAKQLYTEGYYYEAKQELEKVNPNGHFYDKEKTEAWMDAVDAKIADLQYKETRAAVKKILANVKKLNSQWRFAEALAELDKANTLSITVDEFDQLKWWENTLYKNLNSPKYAPVRSNLTAINAVKATGKYTINSKDETFYAVKVASDEWHVYITTKKPNGKRKNVAAFRVYQDGTVNQVL